ncbi:hypothetical protein T492DRAFT_844501 [Pavlovales sp. CCMP2436]|nr:hypothetical protein T492DRAFT_844501 [Pavlovales sp. CCMP2436]
MWTLAASAFLLLLLAASGTCALNEGTTSPRSSCAARTGLRSNSLASASESARHPPRARTPRCTAERQPASCAPTNRLRNPGPSFTSYRVYASIYQNDTAVRKYVASRPNVPTGTADGSTITYVTTFKNFKILSPRDPAYGTPIDLDFGDVDWVAFCLPVGLSKANLPWDEQVNYDTCVGLANIGVPVKPFSSMPPPTWGKPGVLIAAKGGSCELETATKNLPNAECKSSAPPQPTCAAGGVLINEVDGVAPRSGVDWIEIAHAGIATTCELHGCKFLFFECPPSNSCSEISPRNSTEVNFNLRPGGRVLFYGNQDFVPPPADRQRRLPAEPELAAAEPTKPAAEPTPSTKPAA